MASADADLWVGIDLGTQGARVVLVTSTGEPVGHGSRPLRGRRDGDRHEQDPQDWWSAVCGACRDALEGVEPERVLTKQAKSSGARSVTG
jgi:sugar (pentulose or hexulose) kinase